MPSLVVLPGAPALIAARSRAPAAPQALPGALRRVLAAWLRRRGERRAAAELEARSDHLLRDMGVVRGDIDRAVRLGLRLPAWPLG